MNGLDRKFFYGPILFVVTLLGMIFSEAAIAQACTQAQIQELILNGVTKAEILERCFPGNQLNFPDGDTQPQAISSSEEFCESIKSEREKYERIYRQCLRSSQSSTPPAHCAAYTQILRKYDYMISNRCAPPPEPEEEEYLR